MSASTKAPKNRLTDWTERLTDRQFAYLMLLPAFLLISAMAIWPLIRTFQLSLHADSPVQLVGSFVGVSNYIDLVTGQRRYLLTRPFFDLSQPFLSALPVTLIITATSVVLMTVIGIGQALILDRDFKFRRLVRVAILLPWAFPLVIYGMVVYLMFQPRFGFATDLLQPLGFSPIPLSEPVDATFIIIVALAIRGAPFIGLVVLAGLQSINRSLYDVANVMGASRWQQFRLITMPLAAPSLLVGVLFSLIAVLKVFGLPVTVTGDCQTVPTLSCLVYTTFNQQFYGTAAALAFITAGIIGIIVIAYLTKFTDERSL